MQQALVNLHNSKTIKRKMALEQKREVLLQESQLSQLKADTEIANLQVEGQSSLAESGVVSGMDVKRSKLKAKQLKEQLALEQNA